MLELARRVQRWQQHPDGPDLAPKAVKRSALRARDQLVKHNLIWQWAWAVWVQRLLRLLVLTWAEHLLPKVMHLAQPMQPLVVQKN